MGDTIHIDTEWLERCADKLAAARDALDRAEGRLALIALTDDAGAALHYDMTGTYAGVRVSASTVAEAVTALRNALSALTNDADALSRICRRSSDDFTAAHGDVNALIDRLTDELDAVSVGCGCGCGCHVEDTGDGTGGASGGSGGASGGGSGGSGGSGGGSGGGTSGSVGGTSGGGSGGGTGIDAGIASVFTYLTGQVGLGTGTPAGTGVDYAAANGARVFDEKRIGAREYGARQGGPFEDRSAWNAFRALIEKNTGRRLNDQELELYLMRLRDEGCSYAAGVNAIMRAYEGRAEDFEREFGFPMYQDGHLNFDMLLVDFYSSTDNYSRDSYGNYVYDPYEDYNPAEDGDRSGYDPFTDTTGSGPNQARQADRMSKYLSEHGLSFQIHSYTGDQITPETYQTYAAQGEITIGVGYPMYLRNTDGSFVMWSDGASGTTNYSDSGHRMSVTGVTDGGQFVVSSWGERYLVDPNDAHGYMSFQVFTIGR